MRLALFEPDIPQNTGTMLRMAACLGVAVEIIEPAGFRLDDRRMRRAGMDYLEHVTLTSHDSWDDFIVTPTRRAARLVLLTRAAPTVYLDFAFRPNDIIMVGRESAGVPEAAHAAVDARLRVPMAAGLRSLNVALSAAMVLGEALRQTNGFPEAQP
jgi:tRNA (cytidine/uridine-2'-O-)-methyltransferase